MTDKQVVQTRSAGGAVEAKALKEALRDEFEQMVEQVALEVSQAGADDVIGHSEHQVREVMGRFRSRVFERAVQMRIEAAQAAFSPSGEPEGAADAAQRASRPGGADGQRLDPGRA